MTKRSAEEKTSWRKVEEEICGRLKNNSRLIDADKLIQAFEVEEKQTNDEIRVGDEITCIATLSIGASYPKIVRGVVWKIDDDEYCHILGDYDFIRSKNALVKTGRHFDQIEEVLEQMREDKK